MMNAVLIAIVLAVRAWYWDATNTAWDDCRSWAENNNMSVFAVPSELWQRLEKQAKRGGYREAYDFVCDRQPWCYECQPENRD